jgi:hypothetical protein
MNIHCIRRGLNNLYIYKESFIKPEVDTSIKHVVVVWFVLICCPELATLPTSMVFIQKGYIHMNIHFIGRGLNTFYIYIRKE